MAYDAFMDPALPSQIDRDRLVSVVQDLVRIPSVNPPGGEKPVAEYLFALLNQWGFETTLLNDPDPDRPQVLAFLRGSGQRPPLILNGHIDVVPEGPASDWRDPPFSGRIRDGRIYGRGSCDMKGGLGVALEVARVLQTSNRPLLGDLILTFAMGEETGEPGTARLLRHAGITRGFGIVLEPTGLEVCVAEKGLAWFRITIAGRPAHASMPERGLNPIDKFLPLGRELRDYAERIRQHVHPLCGPASCTLTMIRGGIKENVVPDSLSLTLDRRINPDESLSEVQGEIEAILRHQAQTDPSFSARLELIRVYEPAEIPPDLPQVVILREAVETVTGRPAAPRGTPFSTDVRHFIHDMGIPGVTFGPGEIRVPHTTNESIAIQDLIQATRAVLLTAERLLLQPAGHPMGEEGEEKDGPEGKD